MSRFNRTPSKTKRARELRVNTTLPERRLWARLRGAQMEGLSFRRQHPVGPYILDFYCPTAKVAIELDGDQHGTDAALAYDAARTRFINGKGIRVIRFSNYDLMKNFDAVLEAIYRAVKETPTRSARRAPTSPFQGEANVSAH
jgi:very-short-patch-repair endonuclease